MKRNQLAVLAIAGSEVLQKMVRERQTLILEIPVIRSYIVNTTSRPLLRFPRALW